MKLEWTGIVAALLLLGAGCGWAADEAGMVKSLKGTVTIERGEQKIAARVGSSIEAADRVVTGADSLVGITLRDNTLLSAGPNSALSLNQYAFDPVSHAGRLDASVKRGTLSVISGKLAKANPAAVAFHTPTTTLGVRGTEFVIEVAGKE